MELILTIIATLVIIFTCVYALIFIRKAVTGITITVNMIQPPAEEKMPVAPISLEAQQVVLDKAREHSTDITQGIDNMLTELNTFITGGKPDEHRQ